FPRGIRLLERGELLDQPGPERRQVLRGDPGEPLQTVTKRIEPDVRDGIDSARNLEELALPRHVLLERVRALAQLLDLGPVRPVQRARHRERQLGERCVLLLQAMEVVERHRRGQERPRASEIQVAIHGVAASSLDEYGDERDRIVTHIAPHARSSTRCVCRAIMSSSLVGTTQALTRLCPALMRGRFRAGPAGWARPRARAAAGKIRPQPAGASPPPPAVNTIESSPPSAAASEPSSRRIRYTYRSTASFADGAVLASSARMSLEM